MPCYKSDITEPGIPTIQEEVLATLHIALPNIDNNINSYLLVVRLVTLCREINILCKKTYETHTIVTAKKLTSSPNNDPKFNETINATSLHVHIMSIEQTIHTIKYAADSLITILNIISNHVKIVEEKKISISEIGHLIKTKKGKQEAEIFLNQHPFIKKYLYFFQCINTAHNSYKHCILTNESMMLYGQEEPTINAYYIPFNNIDAEPEIYNHYYKEIFLGFKQFLIETIEFLTTSEKNTQTKNHSA